MTSQQRMDSRYGRQGGRVVPMGTARSKFYRGQVCRLRPIWPFTDGGPRLVTVLEVMPLGRVRVAYGDVSSLIVLEVRLDPGAPATARDTDPETSYLAAKVAGEPVKLYRAHRTVLAALRDAGRAGLTDFELAAKTGRKQTSFGVRRGELKVAGLVADSGKRRLSDTATPAIVWEITKLGLEVAGEVLE